MPERKHLRGVSAKEQREYEHIKESAQRSGRYGDRAQGSGCADCAQEAQGGGPQQGTLNWRLEVDTLHQRHRPESW